MKPINLTNLEEITWVDDIDFDYLNQWGWQLNITPTSHRVGNYIRTPNGKKHYTMAREIAKRMGLDIEGKDVDHIDRNPLNNLRNNLRPATRSQNIINRGLQKNNVSGYIGVSYYYQTNKWSAYIMYQRKKYHCGYFNTAIEAAKARDRAALAWFKDRAVLNFPQEQEDEEAEIFIGQDDNFLKDLITFDKLHEVGK